VKWRDIHEWIERKDPSFFETVRGVPLEDIRHVEAARGVKLPRLYVDCLLEMGLHEGTSIVFGGSDIHDFHSLNSEPLEGDPVRSSRYFKIAEHDGTDDIAYIDTYLDLANADDDDALLVQAEAGDESEISRYGLKTQKPLSRFLEWWAFFMFETKDRSEQLSMFLSMNEYREGLEPKKGAPRETVEEYKAKLKPFSRETADERMRAVESVLEERGFALALPRLATFACWSRANASATAELIESSNMIAVYLFRDEPFDTGEIVAELERRVPKLAVHETWRSSRFS
jgi:hypothetical protein